MENKELKMVTKSTMVDDDWGVEYEVTHTQYSDHKEIDVYSEEVDICFSLSYTDKSDLENLAMELALENIKLHERIDNAVDDLKDW
mgnify:CR=1 FL=1